MKRLLHIVRWFLNPFLVKRPEHVKVVVLCIAVATTFWFFIAFNKTYTTVFVYPINYEYNKDKYTPINTLVPTVPISLSGQGWDLLKEYFSLDKKYLNIILSNEVDKEIVTNDRLELAAADIFEGVLVNRILIDSVICDLDYKVSKVIAINLKGDSINLNSNYAIGSKINILPKEIHISGPATIISNIDDTLQLKISKEVDENYDDEISVNLPEKVVCDVKEVNVNFRLSPYIIKKKQFPYTVYGWNDSTLTLYPKIVSATYKIPENRLEDLNDSSILFDLNLNNFIYEKDTNLPIHLLQKPNFVKDMIIEDSLIEIKKID